MDTTKCENACGEDIEIGKHEEWNKKRLAKNARKRERRQNAKEEDPAKYKEECEKRNEKDREKRQNKKSEKQEERRKKQNPNIQFRQELNDLFNSLFQENQHTFHSPISKSKWEKLKKSEIDFLLCSPIFSPNEISMKDLYDYRQYQLEFLKSNPKFPHGGSVIFYIKTMVHNPKDQRIISEDELNYIHSLILPDFPKDEMKISQRKMYYEKNKDKEISAAKSSHEAKKSNQKTHNLNIRFMKEDPNRVLSVDDICNNPFVSNFSQRESYKINLWKLDKNPDYLETWKKQRLDYEKIVAELSIEYKENFLKNKWLAQS